MDKTDRQIVDLLREDGRRSNVEIARVLGISEGTVRKRVDRLLLSGQLKVVGIADPSVVGYGTRVLFLLTVEPARIEAVACLLCDMPEVMSVYHVTGEYDVVVEAVFESDKHLTSFLTERLASIPGMVGSRTSHVLRALKNNYEWALPQPPPPAILIVDDDPDFTEITRTVLEKEGYRTLTAQSGSAALEIMASNPPDLVVLDIMMDGILDGWDASWRIRSNPRLRHTPILVVSSITASDYMGMFPTDEDNLIDNFLSKPVDPQKLVLEVKRLLARG
jgi:Lrp/AsnC family transcriptional regulator for asnA, asnC and gidA